MQPPTLGRLQLKTLCLARNRLTAHALDTGLLRGAVLERLVELDLRSNAIESVPRGMWELRALRTLLLSHNRVRSLGAPLPTWRALRCAASLEHIDVASNVVCALGDLPDALADGLLPALAILDLANNELRDVPPELGLHELRSLLLHGNPQRQVRSAILQQGTPAVLEFLRSRVPPPPPMPPPPSEPSSRDDDGPAPSAAPPPRPAPPTVSELERIDKKINELDALLRKPAGISEAKLYAMRKELRMARAARLKEARRLAA